MIEPKLVTVFGGGGFIGRYVCEQLFEYSEHNVRLRVVTREPRQANYIQPLGQVGQFGFVRADVTDRASVRRALEGAWGVINLTGSFAKMAAVHAEGAKNIAHEAKAAGLRSLVHISAIGSDPDGEATYARTKGEGEKAVREAFPDATIIRPSIVFGAEDQLTNRLAGMARLPALPVIAPNCRFQPVFVEDLAKAIARASVDPAVHGGKTYEIGGAQVQSMRDFTVEILKAAGRETELIDIPNPISSLISRLGFLPGAPLTRDQWLMLQHDNVASGPGLEAFGIRPVPFGAVAPEWLGMYGGNRFARRRVNITAQH
ncbi:complex I NDUFA9 subunit family protein [Sphingomonas daechungensis]|uniref:Complex I NDUFA9 subunit family protein n=1 Tax=Sphingomonas daechungensis TaxID=1176646 RepID=A0ABX6T1R1_9SPHN|nr:complex I NDUFA9 subunit family protein [Sphingomonas daechungensis]QNP43781.1 complex I NDUFA9 subunit family protein [Sphingomonas daechungensis]